MFQGMFRKRRRPSDPLPIDTSSNEEDSQMPVHQLLEAPRQSPLPFVRELELNVVADITTTNATRWLQRFAKETHGLNVEP